MPTLGLALLVGGLAAADAPERLRVGKPHRLKVTHTTRVRVAHGTARLEVWHAKPLERIWPEMKAPLDVEQVALSPVEGKEAPTRTEGGRAWTWELTDPAAGELEFVSTFVVRSCDRDLKSAGRFAAWTELPADTTEVMQGLPPLPTPNETVREAAKALRRKSKDVIEGLTGITQWVNQHVAYQPGVTYKADDLEAICKGGAGHCAHRATVFLAFCRELGIPARRVSGYALLNKVSGGLGGDDSNRHVWAEVHLPTLGWIEVEPAPRGSPFALSHLYLVCPRDLQSRAVIARSKDGLRSEPIVSDTLRVEELR